MNLYPDNNKNWDREIDLIDNEKIIGIGKVTESNNPQIEQFMQMNIGDIVLIKKVREPIAIVKVLGECLENKSLNELTWFKYKRKIEVLVKEVTSIPTFKIPPPRLAKSKNQASDLYKYISSLLPNDSLETVNLEDYKENFSCGIVSLKEKMIEKEYEVDNSYDVFLSELKEFHTNSLNSINKISIQIEKVKGINKLEESFSIDFDNKIYSIVGNNGIGKSALLVALGQLVNQTYLSYEFKGNAYDNSKITFIFNDIIKFEWKKYSSKVDKKIWSLETKNSLSEMPKLNGFFESGIISGTRFENLSIKKHVLNLVERNSIVPEENSEVEKVKFINENLNYIINDDRNTNKYETLFTSKIKNKTRKEEKFFFKNKDGQIISEYSFCTGEYFVLSLLKFIQQYISKEKQSLIIIDEIDISLHPLAQRRLLNKIKNFSKSFNITFVIATHSLQIIENLKQDEIYYFENNNGNVVISNPISPAYVTRNIYEHMYYDKVILVEDNLAKLFLENLICDLRTESKIENIHYQIIDIGGWRKVVETAIENKNFKYYSKAQVIVALDKDIKKDFEESDYNYQLDSSVVTFVPVEENIEFYTIKKLLSDTTFKRMIEDELIKPNTFNSLNIKGKESTSQEIKNKFKFTKNSLIKQIYDYSNDKTEEDIEKKIVSFLYKKVKTENLEDEFIDFKLFINSFLNKK